ncbi:ATP-binding protein [Microbacterium sp. P06]|uniref:sensor histidine kinase n=1 Tax=Microbacterium sp. P06 TaxID=3366949 RepID=UPI00374757D7
MTGVTVTLLAVGLLAAGMGTMAFLRTTLVNNLDASLQQSVVGDLASSVFDISSTDGVIRFEPRDDAALTETFVVIYSPDGAMQAVYDGTNATAAAPAIPDSWPLEVTYLRMNEALILSDPDTGVQFRGAVGILPVDGTAQVYTQMAIQPLAPTERVVGTFVGIYSILALLILLLSALLTRYLVTLTFRGLSQVEATAMSIAAGDFSQRMADVVPGTEVGRLKGAINTMLGRVDASLRQRDATVRQMRRFIGDASHELRTPLVTVRGYAELYRMGAIRSEEDVAQSMERIEKEAIRMGVLVEDLLALARLDEQRDVEITPVDLRPIARDAALDLRAASPQRVVTVEDTTAVADVPVSEPEPAPAPAEPIGPVDTAESKPTSEARRRTSPATSAIAIAGGAFSRLRRRPRSDDAGADASVSPEIEIVEPVVLGEENRIRQVVANLLGNARRFTTEDSPIDLRIGTDATAGMGWIEVIDHGDGVPEQIRDQIFQRFWRADTSRTRETGGAGLGLSIVASIVDALHGTVTVSDTPGGGATFRVSFPLVEAETEELTDDTRPISSIRRDPPAR